MNFLLDPNVAYVLLVIGFIMAILALFSPGTGLIELGALFAIALAGYGMYSLPINWWALVILVLGVFPFLLALRRSRRMVFLVLSIVALIIGSIFLFRNPEGGPAINPFIAILTSTLAAGFMWFVARKGLDALGLHALNNREGLVGEIGEARTDVHQEGSVYAGGEEWSARSVEPVALG
ncbi:MAG: hypothetical protein HGA53_07295, partial [Anaerolineaceae bacterium]|nr:hypothetical protein [Anaerolineaceae bacterium]